MKSKKKSRAMTVKSRGAVRRAPKKARGASRRAAGKGQGTASRASDVARTVSFALNGSKRTVEPLPGESLQALLQRMGIPSVRNSDDGEGFSGSDTILLDGKPVLSGLMRAEQAGGHAVETVESLQACGRLSRIQEAMLDCGAVQSAYNGPAAALLLDELLRRKEVPTEEDVRDALSGLYSRSTGYVQLFRAVALAVKRRKEGNAAAGSCGVAPSDLGSAAAVRAPYAPASARPPSAPESSNGFRTIGRDTRRVDGVKLVSGMKAFVEDRVEPGSCVLLMLKSPHAHAYIQEIDTSAAEKLPGVVMVITWKNCPKTSYTTAGQGFPEPSPYDRLMFGRKVRYVGDRVAAVVADDENTARAALGLIEVRYDVLPPVLGIDAAIKAEGPAVHGGPALTASGGPAETEPTATGPAGTGAAASASHAAPDPREEPVIYQLPIGADPARNLAASASGSVGSVERGFSEADVTIERVYTTSKVQCTPLEPHVVYTRMDGDRLVIHASTQVPWHLRRIVATVLGIGENRVRVIKERVGGGFGSKQDILLEEVAAFATWKTGRPVFFKFSREEEFIASTTRHPFRFTVKMGAKRDGTLTAISLLAEANTGAYGNHCLTVPMNACSKSLPLFRCPNVAFQVRSYYTTEVPSGAYQGYGAPQGSFALQAAAAELAAELGMDHTEFLSKNMVREGDLLSILESLGEGRPGAAVRVACCALDKALEEGKKSIGWGARVESGEPDVRIGVGAAIIQQGSGLPGLDQACADVKLLSDGTFLVRSGGADLGTGLDTVLAKLAAERLCCPVEAVTVISGDTDTTPFDKGAYASSGTYFSGNAVLKAACALADRILETAAAIMGEDPDDLSLEFPGLVRSKKSTLGYTDLARRGMGGEGPGELSGSSSFTSNDCAFPYAAHFCRLAVNVRTGEVKVLSYHAFHDSGTIVNPVLAEGQVHGGILKSLGHALWEEMIFDAEGRCLTTRLAEYAPPMVQELPPDVLVRFIPTEDPYGPYGSKSVSEISVNGAAPAVAAAIHDAAGVWLRDWPFTPERILKAMGRF